MLKLFSAGLRQLLFPDNCFFCRTFLNSNHQRQLCPDCLKTLKVNTAPWCAYCSRHLETYSTDSLCKSCRQQRHAYDRAWAACFYNEPLRRLVHAFKYNGKTALRRTFLDLMSSFITAAQLPLDEFDLIAPIALHPARRRERGFNQAELLSTDLCLRYSLTQRHRANVLIRRQTTQNQALLDQKQRWTNLEGAFRIKPSEPIAGKSVLLVDDLLTTGATANAAAETFKAAGASYVGVLTLAITE